MGGNNPVRIDLLEEAQRNAAFTNKAILIEQNADSDILQKIKISLILHGCGLASSIVAQEGTYLSIIELQGQSIDGQLVSMAVDLHQVLNVDTWLDVSRLLLDTHS